MKHSTPASIRGLIALWMVLFTLFVVAVSNTYSLETQLAISVVFVTLLIVTRNWSGSMLLRYLSLALAMVVMTRYWFWRLFDTLPGTDDPISYAAAIILFSAETLAITVFFVGSFLMLDPIDHARPPAVAVEDLPTVDVLVPSLNESEELLAVTLASVRNLEYPADRLNVVLCDDGGTDQRCESADPETARQAQKRRERLQALCERLGVTYFARPQNIGAKAGNLTEALSHTNAELVVVFDADHAPTEDFLARTVGYFHTNPRLFLVQTPHFFVNRDPIARNLRMPEDAPPENEMFYDRIHRGLDRWGGTFFCGSAAVLRRAALDEIGGIKGDTITEDAETALALHRRGWESMYLNHAMIEGLQPATLASFMQQRGRWLTGMLQLLRTANPLIGRGLRLSQRLCYLNSMGYWLFPLLRFVLLVAPLAYLFFGFDLFVTNEIEAITFMIPYVIVGYMSQNMLFRDVRWTFTSEVYEIVQTPYLLWTAVRTLFRPKGASFSVTSKDEEVDEDHLSDVAGPLLILWAVIAGGVVATAIRWVLFPEDHGVLRIVGGWALFNFILASAALGAVVERRVVHQAPRVKVNQPVRVFDADRSELIGEGELEEMSYAEGAIRLKLGQGKSTRLLRRGRALRLQRIAVEGINPALIDVQCLDAAMMGQQAQLEIAIETRQTAAGLAEWAEILTGDSTRWAHVRSGQRRALNEISAFLLILRMALTGLPRVLKVLLVGRRKGLATTAPSGSPAPSGGGWDPSVPVAAQAFSFTGSGRDPKAPALAMQGSEARRLPTARMFPRPGIDDTGPSHVSVPLGASMSQPLGGAVFVAERLNGTKETLILPERFHPKLAAERLKAARVSFDVDRSLAQ